MTPALDKMNVRFAAAGMDLFAIMRATHEMHLALQRDGLTPKERMAAIIGMAWLGCDGKTPRAFGKAAEVIAMLYGEIPDEDAPPELRVLRWGKAEPK